MSGIGWNIIDGVLVDTTETIVYDSFPTWSMTTPDGSYLSWRRDYKPDNVVNPPVPPGHLRGVANWHRRNWRYRYGNLGTAQRGSTWTRYVSNSGGFSLGEPGIGSFDDELWEKAINGALEKLKNQSVNLSVAFGERSRTADLFLDTAKQISNGVEKFRKLRGGGLWRQVRNSLPGVKELPDEWLKMAYGWTPLLSDVDGACKALSERESGPTPYFVRVSKKTSYSVSSTESYNFMYFYGHPDKPLMMNVSTREDCKAVFYYTLNTPLLIPFVQLGLTNPLDTAWELLPFSFVLDWMLPVGNWINLLDADFGWLYQTGSITQVKEVSGKGAFVAGLDSSLWVYAGNVQSAGIELFEMVRTHLSAPPWAVFPGLRNPFSSKKRVANAGALLSQSFRR